jgi:hypothetical protein
VRTREDVLVGSSLGLLDSLVCESHDIEMLEAVVVA